MKKLNAIKKEIEAFEKGVQELQNELTQKRGEKVKLENEKKQYILSHFGDNRDQNQLKAFDVQLRNLEREIESLEEQVSLLELEKKNKFAPKMDELKKERADLVQKHNERLKEIEETLFKKKLEQMLELEKANIERAELIGELGQYSVIGRFVRDSEPRLNEFTVYAPDYLIFGDGMKAPVVITNNEAHKLTHGGNSPHRLPKSYELYKKTGKVVLSEAEAKEELKKLEKGGK
jgi:hypothetical protein